MYVHPQTLPEATPLPGIRHATWAAGAEGLTQLSLWHQPIAPGGATPVDVQLPDGTTIELPWRS